MSVAKDDLVETEIVYKTRAEAAFIRKCAEESGRTLDEFLRDATADYLLPKDGDTPKG